MPHRTYELWIATLLILALTVLYTTGVFILGGIPKAGDLLGHSLGILGFLLMVVTEIAYSLRKIQKHGRWGKMSSWLQFHIVTGIVGPYLVLLHTAWRFNGLAGLAMLLTLIIVASGFIGRYIYTNIPRMDDGTMMEAVEVKTQLENIENELAKGPSGKTQPKLRLREYQKLQKRRDVLKRQIASLATARRLLSIWHTIHIPIGAALFTAAFIHALAGIYFVTISH